MSNPSITTIATLRIDLGKEFASQRRPHSTSRGRPGHAGRSERGSRHAALPARRRSARRADSPLPTQTVRQRLVRQHSGTTRLMRTQVAAKPKDR
jgi:hypothetical protein